jgi:hypothetical protein
VGTTIIGKRRVVVALFVILLAPASLASATPPGADTVAAAYPDGVSGFTTGATLTQYSLDWWGDRGAVASGRNLLANSTGLVNQHLHGFGGIYPIGRNGAEDWTALDDRFNRALAGFDNVVLTACCVPAYMEQSINGAPKEEFAPYWRPKTRYFQDYADVVLETVQRYPNITHIQVWNEMKGFWDLDKNRWDYASYTTLYNTIWNTVKPVRPDIKIGGPYVVLNSYGNDQWFDSTITGPWGTYDKRDLDVITYWLKNKAGADFIAVDGSLFNKDNVEPADPFAAGRQIDDFTTWLRALNPRRFAGADTLPLWWSEFYVDRDRAATADERARANALMTSTMIRMVNAGVATWLVWGPQGDQSGGSFPLGLFTDTRVRGGGQATALHAGQRFFHDHVGPGTALLGSSGSTSAIEVLHTPTGALLVNTANQRRATRFDGRPYSLAPYEVAVVELDGDGTPPSATITQPTGRRFNRGDRITMTVAASDNDRVDRMTVTFDGQTVCTDNRAPWTCTFNAGSRVGRFAVVATAYDATGNAGVDQISLRIRA